MDMGVGKHNFGGFGEFALTIQYILGFSIAQF
jgi:hypothetical protein